MSIKKTAIITVFVSAIFVSANLMVAQAYEPLVRLPGLPAEGEITLSQYIVGLYNFLLSIVGIVAVMMLIIGGMKYIAAAGNASIIADAKDTISNAIFGLLLALLSWVIVSTINPDVLYIKHPASSLTDAYESNLGACGTYNIDTDICTCQDSVTFIPPDATDQPTCEVACADNCGTTEALPCIYGGSSEKPIYDELGGGCRCVDGVNVVSLAPVGTGCNEICQTPGFVTDGLNHCYVADFRIGKMNIDGNDFPSDKERAIKYALYSAESIDSALDFTVGAADSCYLAVNGADYTTNFDEVTKMVIARGVPSFDGDCNNPLNMDILASLSATVPVPGYIGPVLIPLACPFDGINSIYGAWEADVNCKKIKDPESVVCPIKFCVEWNGGAIAKEKIMFLQMLNSY